jgi:hypothetical protein
MELELQPKDDQPRRKAEAESAEMPVYQGMERRRAVRRVTVDRRTMIRFEAGQDRRRGRERRADLQLWNGRDF